MTAWEGPITEAMNCFSSAKKDCIPAKDGDSDTDTGPIGMLQVRSPLPSHACLEGLRDLSFEFIAVSLATPSIARSLKWSNVSCFTLNGR